MADAQPFVRSFFAGWGDMDFNGHMRNTAFLDRCADVRMLFFAEHGFPMREFSRRRLGPVVMKDVLDYRREVSLLEPFEVTLAVAGLSADAGRFVLRNEIRRPDGTACATVTSTGGWLDHAARRLVAPPEALRDVLRRLPLTADYADL